MQSSLHLQKTPIFPAIKNKRSMIYIDNLCEFIRGLVDLNSFGVYKPQNAEYVCTSELVIEIAKTHEKVVHVISLINPIINLLIDWFNVLGKVFGDLTYIDDVSLCYRFGFIESVKLTEQTSIMVID